MSYSPLQSDIRNYSDSTDSASADTDASPASTSHNKKIRSAPQKKSNATISNDYPIIVHCHLCWDWVWQRPQQFLSRLSKRHPILFVETVGPDPNLVAPYVRIMDRNADYPNVTRLRLQFPSWRWTDAKYVDQARREWVQEALSGPLAGKFENAVQWFYDPMAVSCFAGQMGEIATVYDCMDELSKFRHAPPELTQREAQLLKLADVVFTGGRKMWESKSKHNSNCHFYGCGVDVEHFGRARDTKTVVPHDIKDLKKPTLGFFGVVDERMDYELIAKLADARPEWSIVMIGPVLKVEQSVLPIRENIHWLGGRDYAQLPAYCKGFDVCLMPFAMNEATEYINPTKALEYMATGREIVSSAVPDVVSNFGTVVKIGSSHEHFISLCEEAVEKPDEKAIERGLKMAADNTWECIVEKLEGHIGDALAAKTNKRTSSRSSGVQRNRVQKPRHLNTQNTGVA